MSNSDLSGWPGTIANAPTVILSGARALSANVEPQVGFPVVGIGAVAFEAFVGKDRTDVEVEADLFRVTGVVLVVQAGGKNQNGSCDQDRYGSDATDGSRFSPKVR